MTIRNEIKTEKACKPAGIYSQAIEMDGWVYISGQGPLDLSGTIMSDYDMKEQTQLTMQNIQAIVEEAGLTMGHIVKINAHITDHALFNDFNEVYKQFFDAPYPARTTVVSGLAPGMLVEIDAIARRK